MKHLLIASHGPLSHAIIESAALIAGVQNIEGVHFISINIGSSYEEIIEKVNKIMELFAEKDEILALTDVYGGSITTILSEYVSIRRLHIITGVNLGMVLEAVFMKDSYQIDELINHLIETGKDGIRYVNAELDSERGDEI